MAIGNVTLNKDFSNITSTKAAAADNGSKNIQNQIASKQQRLNRLSSNSEMSAEEKAKERQKIQKQIEELNRKLELLRMEQEKEAKEAKKEQEQKLVLNEEMQAGTVQKEQNNNDVSKNQEEKVEHVDLIGNNIQKILVADALLQKNRIQNSVNTQKEHKENILKSEIKMNELYGNDNTAKKEELSALRNKTTFEIKDKNPPKNQTPSGINSNAKVIIVK